MKEKQTYGFIESDFAFYAEPENGINTVKEFSMELFHWADSVKKNLVILEESMEPIVMVDDVRYVCKLGDVGAASFNNPVAKALHLRGSNRVVGPYLGYKWIYFYKQ